MLKRDDLDAVDVLVPIQLNYEVSEAVLKAGKNLICEKPLAPDMEQARKFLNLAERYNVKIMIAENYRYNEENSKIKEIDAALHDIAAMRHIFGHVVCVQALGKPQQQDFNPYVSVNANILFRGGAIGQYTYFPSGIETQKPLVGFRIFGTKGEIYLEEKTCGVINVTYHTGQAEQIKYTPERGYYNELLNFYNSLNGMEEIYVTPEVEFGDVKMVFDILKSVSKRQIMYVDEPQNGEYINYVEGRSDMRPYIQ